MPATVASGPMVMVGADGAPRYFRSHKAFSVPGRPFMNPTLQRLKPSLFETIRAKVAEATKN